jgi:hypothetical protein
MQLFSLKVNPICGHYWGLWVWILV